MNTLTTILVGGGMLITAMVCSGALFILLDLESSCQTQHNVTDCAWILTPVSD